MGRSKGISIQFDATRLKTLFGKHRAELYSVIYAKFLNKRTKMTVALKEQLSDLTDFDKLIGYS